eukprot:1832716-Amphidinium_carterae.1
MSCAVGTSKPKNKASASLPTKVLTSNNRAWKRLDRIKLLCIGAVKVDTMDAARARQGCYVTETTGCTSAPITSCIPSSPLSNRRPSEHNTPIARQFHNKFGHQQCSAVSYLVRAIRVVAAVAAAAVLARLAVVTYHQFGFQP